MKSLLLHSAGLVLALGAAGAASATSLSLGNELTNACYEAASLKRSSSLTISRCTIALNREASTSGNQRVATLVNRGILFMLAGQSARAVQDFDQALELDPGESEAWLGKALESWKAGDDRDALSFADRAIQLDTRKPAVAYYVRGLANESLGNLRAAYTDLRQARLIAPRWDEPARQLQRYKVVKR